MALVQGGLGLVTVRGGTVRAVPVFGSGSVAQQKKVFLACSELLCVVIHY